jgi:hypothetical protein
MTVADPSSGTPAAVYIGAALAVAFVLVLTIFLLVVILIACKMHHERKTSTDLMRYDL